MMRPTSRAPRPPMGCFRPGDRVRWTGMGAGAGTVESVRLASASHGDPTPLAEANGAALGWSLAHRVELVVVPGRGMRRVLCPWTNDAARRVRVSVEP